MAQQNRTTLQALIDLYITTNGNKEITGAQLNEVLTNLNDSAFLQLDELRTALSTSYNPATPSDWNVLPTEVKAALDEAISRVEGLENAGFQTAIQTPYTATTPTDWDVVPTELQSSTDELASRVETLENEPNQTAFETPYTPTTSADWNPEGAPTEVRGGLDILAARTGQNLSQDIAYVSNDGDDLTAVLGNSEKPFATIQAALNALPVSNCTVKALGGTYTVPFGTFLITASKNNCVVDVSGCTLNGRVQISGTNITLNLRGSTLTDPTTFGTLIANGGADCCILLEGGKINGGVNLSFSNAERISLQGGEIEATQTGQYALRVGEGSVVSNCIISSSQSNAIIGEATDINETPFITNCIISSTSTVEAINDNGNIVFDTCEISGRYCINIGSNSSNGLFAKFINCNITADDRIMIGTNLQGKGLFRGCRLEVTNPISGVNGYAFNLGTNCKSLRIYDCQIITQDTCLRFADDIDRQLDNTIFKDTIFFCNQDPLATGEILVEGTYSVETGTTRFINCTYNKALPALNPTYTFDYNSTTIVGLLPQT